jgi:hypothetical protein
LAPITGSRGVAETGALDPIEVGLATRFLFEEGDRQSLAAQWTGRDLGDRPVLALLRTIPEDPAGHAILLTLWPDLRSLTSEIEDAWAGAELAASASLMGLALGARVALVPMQGRWTTELVSIRTRHRTLLGPGRSSPARALEAAYQALASSFGPFASNR